MRAHRQIVVTVLLLLPLLGWTVAVPSAACAVSNCASNSAVTCHMAHCTMHRGCQAVPAPQWTFPPQLPRMLPAAAVTGIPTAEPSTRSAAVGLFAPPATAREPLLRPPLG